MSAAKFLNRLIDAGLRVTTDGEALAVSPSDRLNEALRVEIRQHKAGLIEALAANDPAPGPDRGCWPRSDAMTTDEINTFTSRVQCFTGRGLALDKAEALADRLVVRDREDDTRVTCYECRNFRPVSQMCSNHGAAGVPRELPTELLTMLQHCDGCVGLG